MTTGSVIRVLADDDLVQRATDAWKEEDRRDLLALTGARVRMAVQAVAIVGECSPGIFRDYDVSGIGLEGGGAFADAAASLKGFVDGRLPRLIARRGNPRREAALYTLTDNRYDHDPVIIASRALVHPLTKTLVAAGYAVARVR